MHAIGIDIGGTKIAGALVSPEGDLVRELRVPTPATDPDAIADAVVDLIKELSEGVEVSAAGVAAAGFVDAARAKIVYAPNLSWRNEPFKAKLEAHLGIKVEEVLPAQTVEQQAAQYGAELWKRDPEKCCELRKVDSLGKKLFDLDLWITGMRRDQSAERSVTPLLSLAARPDNSDVWKLNPLVDWSRDQVWAYLKQHDLPHNVLHDRGYRSIGCWPCTQPTSGGDERGGRWPGFEKKECGLHTRTKKGLGG